MGEKEKEEISKSNEVTKEEEKKEEKKEEEKKEEEEDNLNDLIETFQLDEFTVKVVENEKEMEKELLSEAFSENETQLCILGSEEHMNFLKKRLQQEEEKDKKILESNTPVLSEEKIKTYNNLKAKVGRLEKRMERKKIDIEKFEIADPSGHSTAKAFGKVKNLRHMDEEEREEYKLFKKPKARQFFHRQNGVDILIREKEERTANPSELFFDLIFVAIVSYTAHDLIEDFGWNKFNKFAALFATTWRMWIETHNYLNLFDRGDLFTKIFMYVQMTFLLGAGLSATEALDETKFTFVSCVILTRLSLLLILLSYSFYFIPYFREALVPSMILNVIIIILWIPMYFLEGNVLIGVIWAVNLSEQIIPLIVIAILLKISNFKSDFRIAVNIEHFSERLGLMTIITLGESILAVFFHAHDNLSTVHLFAVLSLLSSFSLQSIYFDVDASSHEKHAIRRSIVTGILYNIFHLPLHMSIVAGSGALYVMKYHQIEIDHEDHAHSDPIHRNFPEKWLYCTAFASTLFTMASISLLHKDKEIKTLVPKNVRIFCRVIVGIIILLLPLAESLSPLSTVAIVSSLTATLFVFEKKGNLRIIEEGEKAHTEKNESQLNLVN